MGARRRTRGRTRAWLVAVLAGLSAALVAMLAVATNLATSAIPAGWKPWADDPGWTWGATAALVVAVVVIAVIFQHVSSAPTGRADVEKWSDEQAKARASGGPANNLPARNPAFVGRTKLISMAQKALEAGPVAVVAIHGLGGIGKSAIALEIAHQGYADGRFKIAWWIRAESAVTLVEDLASLAPALGLVTGTDKDEAVEQALAALQDRHDWLIVFDNVHEPDAVRPWLSAGSGSMLITSRVRGWGNLASQIDLGEFTRPESLAYLRRHSVRRYKAIAANELAELLGDLPLALAQAAGYMDVHSISVDKFLALYRDRDSAGQLLAESVEGYPTSVATTWLMHYDQLAKDEPASLELLRLSSFLDPEDVDLDLILSAQECLPPQLKSIALNPLAVENAAGNLICTGLANRVDDQHVRLHRLVAQVTRLHLSADASPSREDARTWAHYATAVVNDLFPQNPQDSANWERCAYVAAHASTAIEHADYYQALTAESEALRARLAAYLQSNVTGGRNEFAKAASAIDDHVDPLRSRVQSAYRNQVGQIAPDRLTDRLDAFLLRKEIRFERAYREFILTSLRFIDMKGLATVGPFTPELGEVFVDVKLVQRRVQQIAPDVLPEQAENLPGRGAIGDYLGREKPVVLAVVGGPGSGKTTLLRQTALTAVQRKRGRRGSAGRDLPILLHLRDHVYAITADPNISVVELARGTFRYLPVDEPTGWLEQKLRHGECLILLDGLDEVARHEDRAAVAAWTEEQIRQYPRNDFVISSRPYGYSTAPVEGANVVQVCGFTAGQAEMYIRGWYRAAERHSTGVSSADIYARANAAADDLLQRLEQAPALRDLTVSPLLLAMIVNVHRYRGALPGSRADLYAEICQVMLGRRREAQNLPSRLPGPWKENILRSLAYAMMERRVHTLSRGDVLVVIRPDLRRVSREVAPDQFLADVSSDGMLIEHEANQYGFAHITFQEYMAADYIREGNLVNVLTNAVSDGWWRETTLLYVAHSNADPIVKACLEADTVTALALAFDCAEQGRDLAPELRDRLLTRSRPH